VYVQFSDESNKVSVNSSILYRHLVSCGNSLKCVCIGAHSANTPQHNTIETSQLNISKLINICLGSAWFLLTRWFLALRH
jgi:hypothetical protein